MIALDLALTSTGHGHPGREVDRLFSPCICVRSSERRAAYELQALGLAGARLGTSDLSSHRAARGIPPAPERKRRTTWAEFIRIHLALLARTDISAAKVLMRGLVICYVLFFISLESSRIDISRITNCPNKPWKLRVTRNVRIRDAVPDRAAMLYRIVTRYTSLPSKRPEPRPCEV
jgi:putative transposase